MILFPPWPRLAQFIVFLSVLLFNNDFLYQTDVANAFLRGDVEQENYMVIPQGFGNQRELDKPKCVYYSIFYMDLNKPQDIKT